MSKYKPSKNALEFISFVRAANVEDNANAEIHYKLADLFFSKYKQLLVEMSRGFAKSTMAEWLVIYIATLGKLPNFGNVDFIAFVGDSAQNGVKNFFRNVAGKIDQSPFLQKYLTIQRVTDGEMELVNAEGHVLNIKGFGASTNIRGVRYRNKRPDILICDDISTNEVMTSEVIQQTLNNNFYKSLIPAMHPTRYKILMIGTPLSEKDLLHQLSNNPSWQVHKYPLCEKYPCKKEEFKGNWEDRFPYEAVKEKYEMYKASGELQSFYQEYMLELTDLSTLIVTEDDYKWFDPSSVLAMKHNYNFYITTDFAVSQKSSADFSTIGVWAISSNGDWFLVDGQCKRQKMPTNIDDLFRYAQKYKPMAVGIEISGQQGGFLNWIENEMIRRNIFFTLASRVGSNTPGIRPTSDKLQRFVTGVAARFKQGKIWFPKFSTLETINLNLQELVEELTKELSKLTLAGGVKSLAHDDAIDLLNQLSEIDIYLPSADTIPLKEDDKGVWVTDYEDDDYNDSYEVF